VLVVAPTPGRGGEGIARDVLRAMGKRFDLPQTPRDPATLLARAELWLLASRVTTLIVRHAERLAADTWRHLAVIGPDHVALWLLADPAELTASHHDAGQDLEVTPGSLGRLTARIGSPARPACWATRLVEQTPTPIAPDIDYAFFAVASQAPCREALFANFMLGRDHADWYLRHVSRELGSHGVSELLTAVARCAADREAAIARVRGAQAQLLLAGLHTSIYAGQLRARLASSDLSPPNANAAGLLRSYVESGPAAAAVCLATGRGPGWLGPAHPQAPTRGTHRQLPRPRRAAQHAARAPARRSTQRPDLHLDQRRRHRAAANHRRGHPSHRAASEPQPRHPHQPAHVGDGHPRLMNARLGPDELRRRRLELGLTRRELARRAAVDLSVIEDAEIHGIPIYDHTASLLAGELGIDTSRVPQRAGSSSVDVEMLGAVLADLGTPIATQTIAAALAWSPERVRDAAAQLRHELQPLGQTVTLSPSDQLGLAPFASCISDEQRAAVRREALTIDDATAHVLLAVLRGRRDERSWNKLEGRRPAAGRAALRRGATQRP